MNVNLEQAYQNICAQLGDLEMQREEIDKRIEKVRGVLRATRLLMDTAKAQQPVENEPT